MMTDILGLEETEEMHNTLGLQGCGKGLFLGASTLTLNVRSGETAAETCKRWRIMPAPGNGAVSEGG